MRTYNLHTAQELGWPRLLVLLLVVVVLLTTVISSIVQRSTTSTTSTTSAYTTMLQELLPAVHLHAMTLHTMFCFCDITECFQFHFPTSLSFVFHVFPSTVQFWLLSPVWLTAMLIHISIHAPSVKATSSCHWLIAKRCTNGGWIFDCQ